MDEKKLNELLASLSEEQKAKVAACKDNTELFALLGEMGVALPDELLDDAAGGFVWAMPQRSLTGSAPDQSGSSGNTGNPDPFSAPKSKRIF